MIIENNQKAKACKYNACVYIVDIQLIQACLLLSRDVRQLETEGFKPCLQWNGCLGDVELRGNPEDTWMMKDDRRIDKFNHVCSASWGWV